MFLSDSLRRSLSYLWKFGSRTLAQLVSVISVSIVSLTSQSYHCKIWFQRLNHISPGDTLRVSLISVSFGSFSCSHIRYSPINLRFASREEVDDHRSELIDDSLIELIKT